MSVTTETVSEAFWAQNDKDTWQTPPSIIDILTNHLTIHTDPCAGPETDIGETNLWFPQHDGLEEMWHGTAFVNPPFSEKGDWIDRAIDLKKRGEIERAILLLPDSTDVKSWWHGKLKQECDEVWFSRGRVKYIDPETGEKAGSPTFGTALNFLGEFPDSLYEELAENGDMCYRHPV